MAEYAGESVAKKVARIRLYVRAAKVLRELRIGPHAGDHVVLCGPSAAEIGCLKHIMRAQPERCLFVDRLLPGLLEAERRWPGVRVYNGDVSDALRENTARGRACRFVHLDFLGHLNQETVESIWQANLAINNIDGAVVALTFLRGRESSRTPLWTAIRERAPRIAHLLGAIFDVKKMEPSVQAIFALDPTRMQGYSMALSGIFHPSVLVEEETYAPAPPADVERLVRDARRTLMNTGLKAAFPVLGIVYDSGRSPMGVVAHAVMLHEVSQRRKVADVLFGPLSEVAHRIPEDAMKELLTLIDWMEGIYGIDAACEIASISRGTLAALRAHRTRGTYDGFGYFLEAV